MLQLGIPFYLTYNCGCLIRNVYAGLGRPLRHWDLLGRPDKNFLKIFLLKSHRLDREGVVGCGQNVAFSDVNKIVHKLKQHLEKTNMSSISMYDNISRAIFIGMIHVCMPFEACSCQKSRKHKEDCLWHILLMWLYTCSYMNIIK